MTTENPYVGKVFKHKASGDLYEVQGVDGGYVQIVSTGGGFLKKVLASEFFGDCEEYTGDIVEPRPAWVGADWMEACYPCWAREKRWNGWAVPYFTREQIEEMLAAKFIDGNDDFSIKFDEARGAYVLNDEDGEHVFEAVEVVQYGQIVKVFCFDYGWCWSHMGWRD